MRIAAKNYDLDSLEAIKNFAVNYIKLLPNIPYKAYGANFIWLMKADASESIPTRNININESSDLIKVLSGHELSYGYIIKAKRSPYLLKLIVEPQEKNSLTINFNYHHEITGKGDKLSKYISNYRGLLDYSQIIVNSISEGG